MRLAVFTTSLVWNAFGCGLLSMIHQAPAAEGTLRDTIRVGNASIRPLGDISLFADNLTLHAHAMVGIGYNSNVFAVTDAVQDDMYYEANAGVVGRWRRGQQHLIEFDLEVFSSIYAEEEARDMVGGKADIEWAYEGISTTSSTALAYSRVDDPLIETGEQIETSRASFSSDATFDINDVTQLVAGAFVGLVDYHDNGLTFDDEARDAVDYGVRLTWMRRMSERQQLDVFASVTYRSIHQEDSIYNDSIVFTAQARWRHELSSRALFAAGAGLQLRRYEDNFASNPDFADETVFIPIANIRYQYQLSQESSRLELGAYSMGNDSTTANATTTWGLNGTVSHALSSRFTLGGKIDYWQVNDSGSGDGLNREQRDTIAVSAQASYQWRAGYAAQTRISYTDSVAEVGDTFHRFDASLGLIFIY